MPMQTINVAQSLCIALYCVLLMALLALRFKLGRRKLTNLHSIANLALYLHLWEQQKREKSRKDNSIETAKNSKKYNALGIGLR